MDRPTKRSPTTVPKTRLKKDIDINKPMIGLPFREQKTSYAASQRSGEAKSLHPQATARSIQKSTIAEMPKISQSTHLGESQLTKPEAMVQWQPPSNLSLPIEKSGRVRDLGSSLLSGSWLGRAREEEIVLDADHQAADRLIDELNAMFKPTLEGRGGEESEESSEDDE